jgi:hypothetical protein
MYLRENNWHSSFLISAAFPTAPKFKSTLLAASLKVVLLFF